MANPYTPGTPITCSGQYIIDYLAKQPDGVFTNDVIQKTNFRDNWWYMRLPRAEFPMHMGVAPSRRVAARQRGGELFNGNIWTRSNGTGSAADNMAASLPVGTAAQGACCPPYNQLKRGYSVRPLTQFNWAWFSSPYCAKDFNIDVDPVSALALEFTGFGDQIKQSIAVFNRNEYIRNCTIKVYATPGPGLFGRITTNTVGDPTQMQAAYLWNAGAGGSINAYANYLGLNPAIKPTSTLNQDLTTKITQYLNANGANGVSMTNGAYNYELVTDPLSADAQLRDVTNFTTWQYADMGKGDKAALLQGLGSMQVFRNIAYQIDPYALALDNNYNPIPATISVATSSGFEDQPNPAWFTAPYRVSIFYSDDVMEVGFPTTAASPGGNIKFEGYNYAGSLKFKLDPLAPAGDQGYFYSEILASSQPMQQQHGVVIIHLGCNPNTFRDCNGVITVGYY